MALQRKICVRETCDGFDVVDITGPYDAEDNPGGYGPENGIESPTGFSSDTVDIYQPGVDLTTGTPIVLPLFPVPTPDDDGFYTWGFTKSDLNLTEIKSGVWSFEVKGVDGAAIYSAMVSVPFTKDVWEKLKPKVYAFDPSCPCRGCTNPNELFMQLQTVRCNGICDLAKAQRAIDWIYSQLKSCC